MALQGLQIPSEGFSRPGSAQRGDTVLQGSRDALIGLVALALALSLTGVDWFTKYDGNRADARPPASARQGAECSSNIYWDHRCRLGTQHQADARPETLQRAAGRALAFGEPDEHLSALDDRCSMTWAASLTI